MRLVLSLLLVASCGPKPKPCPPVEPPIIVTPDPTPCELPELPEPIALGAYACGAGIICVPRAAWDALGGYLAGARGWIQTAAACLEQRR